MNGLLAAAAGAAVLGGLLLVYSGLHGTAEPARPVRASRGRLRARLSAGKRSGRRKAELAAAVAVAVVVFSVSAVPVAALLAGAAVGGVPALLRSIGAGSGEIARLEALQTWARRLSDMLGTNNELTRTLVDAARSAPAAIAAPMADLAARLDAGWEVEPALDALADDLDLASGDLIVAALKIALRDRGGGLAEVLTRLADTVAADVDARRSIQADRKKPRHTARLVILTTIIVATGMALFTGFLVPFSTAGGQLVLAGIGVYMAGCLLWLRSIAAPPPETRFLTAAGGAR